MFSWTVLSFYASSFATFSKASSVLSNSHSETFTSFLKVFFGFFPISTFQGEKAVLHHLCVQSVSLQHFTCSEYSLAGDSSDPVFLRAFLLRTPLETCLHLLFLGKNIPTSLARIVLFPIIFQSLPRCAVFLHKSMPLPLCQWFVSFCLQRLVVTFLA